MRLPSCWRVGPVINDQSRQSAPHHPGSTREGCACCAHLTCIDVAKPVHCVLLCLMLRFDDCRCYGFVMSALSGSLRLAHNSSAMFSSVRLNAIQLALGFDSEVADRSKSNARRRTSLVAGVRTWADAHRRSLSDLLFFRPERFILRSTNVVDVRPH